MNIKRPPPSLPVQVWYFFLHLRWHYQLFILSGGFLLGGYLASEIDWQMFIVQFGNVHLLLFGGATAYNSYWDKDKGPVGGLKNPPPMAGWMHPASLLMQAVGALIALSAGLLFTGVYLFSMLLFWLYSTPLYRWKGRPLLSLVAIGISTGANSVFLGYLSAAAGSPVIPAPVFAAAAGTACMLLSLYPLSQIYQTEEDTKRGDRTFAASYGYGKVVQFFRFSYGSGLLLVTLAIFLRHPASGMIFLLLGCLAGIGIRIFIRRLTTGQQDYEWVMRIKYGTSLALVSFLVILLLLKHSA